MRILIDDIMKSEKQTLVNTVNCVGVMGKGIALEFKKAYPDMYREYVSLCDRHVLKPGKPYLYTDLTGTSILLFPTKDHWRSPSKMEYITKGLDWFVNNYEKVGITSIAFPPLGCGNGGLNWDTVGPVMYQKLSGLPIDIDIYAPYGTKAEQLNEAYLQKQNIDTGTSLTGDRLPSVNKRWLLALETIRRVNSGKYTLHVGRVAFQKICYVLTRSGVDTGFRFSPEWYGPYSEQVKKAITILSNSNLISEKQVPGSKMIEINVTPSFSFRKELYTKEELDAMERCVDLFSRIKNTDHAEVISTVMYVYDENQKTNKNNTEQDIYNGVMNWKKRWRKDRSDEVRHTIRGLASLGWIKPIPSFGEMESA